MIAAMLIQSTDSTYSLAEGRLMRVERAQGWTVQCQSGRLVVTQAGDGEDHELAAGDRLVVRTDGRVLVGAESDATFTLCPPPGLYERFFLRRRLARNIGCNGR